MPTTTYTIEAKRQEDGQWQELSSTVQFDQRVESAAVTEAEMIEEMRSYGPIAIRCRIEVGNTTRYLMPDGWKSRG